MDAFKEFLSNLWDALGVILIIVLVVIVIILVVAIQSSLLEQESIEGALVISGAEQPKIEVYDDLWSVVGNVCFQAATAILEEKHECYMYRYYTSSLHLFLVPMASTLRIIGEDTPRAIHPLRVFLREAFLCGERYMDLMRRLDGLGFSRTDLGHLEPLEIAARTALHKHGILE